MYLASGEAPSSVWTPELAIVGVADPVGEEDPLGEPILVPLEYGGGGGDPKLPLLVNE